MARASKKNHPRVTLPEPSPEVVERIRSAQANLGGGEMTLPRDLDLTDADRRAMAVMREVASMPPGRKRADEISLYAARRIREELGALGMSQSRLAVQTGMDPMYLSRRLSGKVDLAFHEVVGIAAVLDLSLSDLCPPRLSVSPAESSLPAGRRVVTGEAWSGRCVVTVTPIRPPIGGHVRPHFRWSYSPRSCPSNVSVSATRPGGRANGGFTSSCQLPPPHQVGTTGVKGEPCTPHRPTPSPTICAIWPPPTRRPTR